MMDYSAKKMLKKQPRKKGSYKILKGFNFHLFAKVTVVFACVLGGMCLSVRYYDEVRTNLKKALDVTLVNIEVEGNKIVSERNIVESLGLQSKENLLALDLKKARRNIKSNPYIKDVELKKTLPDTLSIKVLERTPHSIIEQDGLWYVDSEGVAFKKVNTKKGDKLDYPIITGIPEKDKEALSYRDSVLMQSFQILNYLEEQKIALRKDISEINFCELYGFSIYLGKIPYRVVLGFVNIKEKIKRFKEVLKNLQPLRNSISLVDMDFKEKAIVKLKKAM